MAKFKDTHYTHTSYKMNVILCRKMRTPSTAYIFFYFFIYFILFYFFSFRFGWFWFDFISLHISQLWSQCLCVCVTILTKPIAWSKSYLRVEEAFFFVWLHTHALAQDWQCFFFSSLFHFFFFLHKTYSIHSAFKFECLKSRYEAMKWW